MGQAADPVEDQKEAAEKDAGRTFEQLVARGRDLGAVQVAQEVPTAEASRIVRDLVERFSNSMDETSQACPHVSASPEVVYGAASLPGFAACQPCMFMRLREAHRRTEETYGGRECDSCGQVVSGGHQGVLRIRFMIVVISLCVKCTEEAHLTGGK